MNTLEIIFLTICSVVVIAGVFTPYGRALNFIYNPVSQKDNNWTHFDKAFNDLNQLIKFTCIVIWMVIYNFVHYNKRFQEAKYAHLIAENKLKGAELTNLRQQLNPHFLFNALNSIHALASLKEDKTESAVLNLSDLMRYHLNYEKRDFVTVQEEMDTVRKYLELEKIRYDKCLTYEIHLEDAVLNQEIPIIMVQILVENAIKHGISKLVNGGVVRIIARFKDNDLELLVQNTGQLNGYINGEASQPALRTTSGGGTDGEGFGIKSTQDRLNLMYQGKAVFEIRNIGSNMVESKVSLPVII